MSRKTKTKQALFSVYLTKEGFCWQRSSDQAKADLSENAGTIELSPEILEEIGGGNPAPAESWAELRKSLAFLRGTIVVGLSGANALIRILDLPEAEPSEISGMVRLQLDKYSPFSIDSMVVSHETAVERQEGSTVIAAAVKNDIATNVGKFFEKAGYVPARMDLLPLAWWDRIVRAKMSNISGREMHIILEAEGVQIIVCNDGVPELFRSVEMDGDGASFMDDVTDDVRQTLMSLELGAGISSAAHIHIWAEGGASSAFAGQLAAAIVPENVTVGDIADLGSVGMGLLARMDKPDGIDLTPAAVLVARESRVFRKRFILVAAVIAGVWGLSIAIFWGMFTVRRFSISELERKRSGIADAVAEVKEMRSRVNAVKRYMDRQRSALECLREICIQLPTGVQFSQFTYHKGQNIKISGEADGAGDIYEFKSNLDSSSLFKGSALNGVQKIKGKEIFEVELFLPGGEE